VIDRAATKAIYNSAYRVDAVNYGSIGHDVSSRYEGQLHVLRSWFEKLGIGPNAVVIEVGAGLGYLHPSHPNWLGIEYSSTAVEEAKKLFGEQLRIIEGDATALPLEASCVDVYYSFATLEHVPNLAAAIREIERVVRAGGAAILGPAWNCRPWTVKKLQQRPYSELALRQRLGKLLIPVRNNLLFRTLCSVPARALREMRVALGERQLELQFRPLEPDFSLWNKYPHISDDDAFASIDAHAAISYFHSRGWRIVSHDGLIRRMTCRSGAIVIQKPTVAP
jgi:SAM-dependent methyltransferase